MLGRWLRRAVSDVDALWVNDPVAGVAALSSGVPAVYDVTDDWRSMAQPPADRARLVAAEDELAGRASVVVCSEALRARWMTRYGLSPPVVTNGVDVEAIRSAAPRRLTGPAPHVVYVGTVHVNRLDVELVEQLARAPSIGTVHLVGPDHLDRRSRERLTNGGARLHGAVAAAEVPSWLVSSDVLICPHVVDDFTLSLDAIKSHEYLATDRPIVATRSSGFQTLSAPGLTVTDRSRFLDAVTAAAGAGSVDRTPPPSWDVRAAEFARVLRTALAAPGAPGPHR
jgi:glycosyltransferase involved in cell wall biosynthesis